jgi:hypothetical protein
METADIRINDLEARVTEVEEEFKFLIDNFNPAQTSR